MAKDLGPLPPITNSGLPPLASIATALREDRYAVAQGITSPYDSGVNEGRITDVNPNRAGRHQPRRPSRHGSRAEP